MWQLICCNIELPKTLIGSSDKCMANGQAVTRSILSSMFVHLKNSAHPSSLCCWLHQQKLLLHHWEFIVFNQTRNYVCAQHSHSDQNCKRPAELCLFFSPKTPLCFLFKIYKNNWISRLTVHPINVKYTCYKDFSYNLNCTSQRSSGSHVSQQPLCAAIAAVSAGVLVRPISRPGTRKPLNWANPLSPQKILTHFLSDWPSCNTNFISAGLTTISRESSLHHIEPQLFQLECIHWGFEFHG